MNKNKYKTMTLNHSKEKRCNCKYNSKEIANISFEYADVLNKGATTGEGNTTKF